jgi:glycosyltransferase involved in cell wall biosynthesis
MSKKYEFSLVIPCLNEEKTLSSCIAKAQQFFRSNDLSYEIVVADNGSTDKSIKIAKSQKVKVVFIKNKGYGSALQGGIEKTSSKYIIMGDADDSYDFSKLSAFVKYLKSGHDFVIGNRFSGKIMPGAMPWQNRFIGNPILSFLGRVFFKSSIGDFHCGLRAFSKNAWRKMDLQTTGMEYASEMVIKSTLLQLRIAEVPITYYKDGRSKPSRLNRWRDGWRHLRFMLLFAPKWLYRFPGVVLLATGSVLFLLVLFRPINLFGIVLDVHTLLVSSILMILGLQIVLFGIFAEIYISQFQLLPVGLKQPSILDNYKLEIGLIVGLMSTVIGFFIFGITFYYWLQAGFGPLDYSKVMRLLIPAVFFMQLGTQIIFNSFFLGFLLLPKKS